MLLLFACLFSFPLSLQTAPAHGQQVDRILILYSNWRNEAWSRDFDIAFNETVRQAIGNRVEISAQHLGLNTPLPDESRERQQRNIESIVAEQGVDLIVAVQYDAIQFYSELAGIDHLPSVLVLPGDSALAADADSGRVRVVNSAWREALSTTVSQILAMRPRTETIEVISGNHEFDLFYLAGFQEIARNYTERVEFNYLVGADPVTIVAHVAQLPQNAALMLLTTEAYGPEKRPLQSALLPYFIAESSVPAYGMYDSAIEFGIVGGHLTSVAAYAESAVNHAASLLGLASEPIGDLSGARSMYNWEQLDRWGLSVSDLTGDIQLFNVPASFIQENFLLTIVATNIFLLLAAALIFLAILLKRSNLAKQQILESEEQARSSEERYKILASNVADVIWSWKEGCENLKYCSPSVARLTGFTQEEFEQIPLRKIMPEESLQACQQVFQSESSGPKIVEVELFTKDGGIVSAEMVVQRNNFTEDGDAEWTGVTRNITQRKQDELDRQVAEEQRKQAQKFESLGTLAGGIAHDFNNILAVIFGVTDMLKSEYAAGNKEASLLLEKLTSASEKAKSLVQQILTFSRGSKGKSSVFEFGDVLSDCIDLLSVGNPNKISLNLSNNFPEAKIRADRSQIEQVIVNVLTNAIESYEEDLPRINVQIDEIHIVEKQEYPYGSLRRGDYLKFSVIDEGAGIDDEALGNVFDPFYTSKELGNGLGLAIVHGIVIKHRGAINIESVRGSGTTVEIYLPLSKEDLSVSRRSNSDSESENASKRIMVIDDNEALLNVCSSMLQHLGHVCIACSDPTQARRLIAEQSDYVDLIITDYSMPKVSGLDIVAYCSEEYPSIPVILCTGFGDDSTKNIAAELGAKEVLNKPFNLSTLREAISHFPRRTGAQAGEHTRLEVSESG